MLRTHTMRSIARSLGRGQQQLVQQGHLLGKAGQELSNTRSGNDKLGGRISLDTIDYMSLSPRIA